MIHEQFQRIASPPPPSSTRLRSLCPRAASRGDVLREPGCELRRDESKCRTNGRALDSRLEALLSRLYRSI